MKKYCCASFERARKNKWVIYGDDAYWVVAWMIDSEGWVDNTSIISHCPWCGTHLYLSPHEFHIKETKNELTED